MRIVILSQDYPPAAYLIGRVLEASQGAVQALVVAARPGRQATLSHVGQAGLMLHRLPPRVFLWQIRGRIVTMLHERLRGKPGGRAYALSVPDLGRTASVPVLTVHDANDPQTLQGIARMQPDLILSVHYPWRIGPALLGLPRLGALNIHPSLLPRHRGLYPALQALIQGDDLHGVTVHLMDEGFDTGAIVEQRSFAIGNHDSYLDLQEKCLFLGGDMLGSVLRRIQQAGISSREQSASGACYASWPTAQDMVRFKRSGRRHGSPARHWKMLDRLERDLRRRLCLGK